MRSTLVVATVAALAIASPVIARGQADSITYRKLDAPATIEGVPCAASGRNASGFHANGRLESCALAHDAMLGGHALNAGTWVYLTPAGRLWRAWLIRDTPLQGHQCKGTGYKGWSVEFHPTARLSMCYLASERVVDGVPCRGGSFWGELRGGVKTWFHENGKLRSCSLARSHTHGGVRYDARVRIELDSAGAPVPRTSG